MINDAHLHIGYNDEMSLYSQCFNKESFNQFMLDKRVHHCLAFPIHHNPASMKITHQWLRELSKVNPCIHPLYWLRDDWDSYNLFVDAINDGFAGFKYHAAYEKTPISHHNFDNVLTNLNARHGILLVHCGMYKEGDLESSTSYLHAVLVAARYPKIKVILGHMGGSIEPVIKKVCDHVKGIDNIWLETSGITSPRMLTYASERLGIKKILFGSDAPWCSFSSAYFNVMDSSLPDTKKQLILYDNFLDMLNG